MRRPRFSILGLMASVTLLALDSEAIRMAWWLETAPIDGWRRVAHLLLYATTAMATALAVAAWSARRHRGRRSSIFLAVGTPLTLALIAASCAAPSSVETILDGYAMWFMLPLERILPDSFRSGAVAEAAVCAIIMALLSLPLMLPSLLAAWFFGRYRVRIERRRPDVDSVE